MAAAGDVVKCQNRIRPKRRNRRTRETGDDSSLVSGAHREEVRWDRSTRSRSASREAPRSGACGQVCHGEPKLGVYEDSRCPSQPWRACRAQHASAPNTVRAAKRRAAAPISADAARNGSRRMNWGAPAPQRTAPGALTSRHPDHPRSASNVVETGRPRTHGRGAPAFLGIERLSTQWVSSAIGRPARSR